MSSGPARRRSGFFDSVRDGERAVVLEDDGVVGWAYLQVRGAIVSDVWLYNVGPDPDAVALRGSDDLPPPNPREFCGDARLPRLEPGVKVECYWLPDGGVEVVVDGRLWARLKEGVKPAWSVGCGKPGPNALPLLETGPVSE